MIKCTRTGKETKINVSVSVPYYEERVFPFTFQCNSEEYAGLLTAAIRDAIAERVQEVKKEYYDAGYADGKGKKAKQYYFNGVL